MATGADNFAGTGALSANWTSLSGTATRVSGQVTPVGGAAVYAWNANSFGADQYVTITLTGVPNSECAAFSRLTAGFNGYFAEALPGGVLRSARSDAGVNTTLESLSGYTFVAGDVLGIRTKGSNIRMYYNGVAQGTGATDATYSAAANTGFALSTTTDTIEGWTGTDVPFSIATSAGKTTTTVTAHRLIDVAAIAPAGTSTAVATGKFLNNQHHLASTVTGLSTLVSTAERWRNATGVVTGVATATTILTKIQSTSTATVTGQSTVATAANRWRNSTTSAAGTAGVVPVIIRWRDAQLAPPAGLSSTQATVGRLRNSTVAVTGASALSLTLHSALTAGVFGSATVSTTASRIRALQLGGATGLSTVQSSGIRWRHPTLSLVTGMATPSVSIGGHRSVTTTTTGVAGLQVSAGAHRRITTSVAGVTSLALQLFKAGSLLTSASGQASFSLTLAAIRSLLTVSTGTSTSTVSASRIRGATLTVTGLTSPSITLNAIYGHETPSGQGLATVAAAIGKLNNQSHVASEADGTSTAIALCGTLVVPPSVVGKYSSQHLQAISILGATRDLSDMHTRALAMLAEKGV